MTISSSINTAYGVLDLKKENTMLEPSQMAVIWTMENLQDRRHRAPRSAKPQRSFRGRLGGTVRRFAFRTQLGPVDGHAPA